MRVTQQPTLLQIVVEVGRNLWENVKQALHLSQHLCAVLMEKLLPQSLSAVRLNVLDVNQVDYMQQPLLQQLSDSQSTLSKANKENL
jgi:hypothetical protein